MFKGTVVVFTESDLDGSKEPTGELYGGRKAAVEADVVMVIKDGKTRIAKNRFGRLGTLLED